MTDARTHRRSALTVAAVLALFAAWNFFRARPNLAAALGAVSASLALMGWLIPPAAAAFHKGWMGVAHVLGYVNTRILLSLMYFGVMTPIGWFARLAGRDPLQRRGKGGDTYWVQRQQTRQEVSGFERGF